MVDMVRAQLLVEECRGRQPPVRREGVVRDRSDRDPAAAAVEPIAGAASLGVEGEEAATEAERQRLGRREEAVADPLPALRRTHEHLADVGAVRLIRLTGEAEDD